MPKPTEPPVYYGTCGFYYIESIHINRTDNMLNNIKGERNGIKNI